MIDRRFRSPRAFGWRAAVAFLTLGLLAPLAATRAEAPAPISTVAAEGTQFRLTLADGRVLRSPDLVGAAPNIVTLNGPLRIRVTAVEHDPQAKTGDVWLHTLLQEQPDGTTVNLCQPGPDGRQQAFPISGRFDARDSYEAAAPEVYQIVCTFGARAKCVRFGYRPWEPAERDLYAACTRMVRADYRGDAVPTTRDGTWIDLFDDRRIQTTDSDPTLSLEAGWTPRGAVCVNHVRVKENISLEKLAASCPRLAHKLGENRAEDTARHLGTTLFNRSAR